MAPDERRAAIIAAVVPVLIARGREATSRELAEAAGVAEGTLFRAFGDKESLIEAVVQQHRDLDPLRVAIEGVQRSSADADEVIDGILGAIVERMSTLVRLASALNLRPPIKRGDPAAQAEHAERLRQFSALVTGALEPHADRLTAPPAAIAAYLRLVATAAALPHLHTDPELSMTELARLVRTGAVRP